MIVMQYVKMDNMSGQTLFEFIFFYDNLYET